MPYVHKEVQKWASDANDEMIGKYKQLYQWNDYIYPYFDIYWF